MQTIMAGSCNLKEVATAVSSHAVFLRPAVGVLQRRGGVASIIGREQRPVASLSGSLSQQILILMEHSHEARPDVLCTCMQMMDVMPQCIFKLSLCAMQCNLDFILKEAGRQESSASHDYGMSEASLLYQHI